MARTVPIWSDAYKNWQGAPWGNWQEWAPWYTPLSGRIQVEEAGPEVRAGEIYNSLLPFLHPRDMQTYLRSLITNDLFSAEVQPLYAYRQFWSQDPDMARNWQAPRRLNIAEEYNMSKRDKISALADALLGEVKPVSGVPGDSGPFVRPGDEDIDSLVGGLLEKDDPIRPYVEALLGVSSTYAPGGSHVGSRRSMAQQAEYEIQFQNAMDALRRAEDSSTSWADEDSDSGYVSNILEDILQPGYYVNPAKAGTSPARRQYRYLYDQYKPYRSSYYY